MDKKYLEEKKRENLRSDADKRSSQNELYLFIYQCKKKIKVTGNNILNMKKRDRKNEKEARYKERTRGVSVFFSQKKCKITGKLLPQEHFFL